MAPTRRSEALHAYAHAADAQKPHPHRVDVVDEPVLNYGAPRARPVLVPVRWDQPPRRDHVDQAFAEPTATAFKVGFGFAAGTGLFRLVTTVAGLLVIFALAAAALSALD